MVIVGTGRQPDAASGMAQTLGEAEAGLARAAGEPGTPDRDPNTIGVVFVHGVGSQRPGEWLLEACRPFLRLIGAWRATTEGVEPGQRPDRDGEHRLLRRVAAVRHRAGAGDRRSPGPDVAHDRGLVGRPGEPAVGRADVPLARALGAQAPVPGHRLRLRDRGRVLPPRRPRLPAPVPDPDDDPGHPGLPPVPDPAGDPVEAAPGVRGDEGDRLVPRRLVRRHADPDDRPGAGGEHPGPRRRGDPATASTPAAARSSSSATRAARSWAT